MPLVEPFSWAYGIAGEAPGGGATIIDDADDGLDALGYGAARAMYLGLLSPTSIDLAADTSVSRIESSC
jgi:hypothetical protein